MHRNVLKFPRIGILFLLFTFANFMGLLLTPAMVSFEEIFHKQASQGVWIMSIFLVGYSFGQLLYGPFANRFGRKPAISLGMALTFLGTVAMVFSKSFPLFILARLVQSIGASVGIQLGLTIVADLEKEGAARKAVASLTAGFGIMPGISIAIGGLVTQYFGPMGCLYTLLVYSILIWLLCQFLPETAGKLHPYALKLDHIFNNYLKLFRDGYLVLYSFTAGLTTALIYTFVTLAPYLGIEVIQMSPASYGYFSLVPSLGMVLGAFITRKIGYLYSPLINIFSGILLILIASVVVSYFFAVNYLNEFTLFIPAFFLYLGSNLVWSNAIAKGVTGVKDRSNASAVMQFINMGTAMVAVFIVQQFSPTYRMLFPASLTVIFVLLLLSSLFLRRYHDEGRSS